MSTQVQPTPTDTDFQDPKPAAHYICRVCYPIPAPGHVALCGYKTRTLHGGSALRDHPLCVVCQDLLPRGCPECGTGR